MSSLGFFALVSIAVEHQDGSWSEVNKLTVRASPQSMLYKQSGSGYRNPPPPPPTQPNPTHPQHLVSVCIDAWSPGATLGAARPGMPCACHTSGTAFVAGDSSARSSSAAASPSAAHHPRARCSRSYGNGPAPSISGRAPEKTIFLCLSLLLC
jgi:hypothetical protein